MEVIQIGKPAIENASAGACPTGIPLEAIPVIQDIIIDQVVKWEILFMVVGTVIGLGASYLYFRIWYAEKGIASLLEDEDT